MNDAQVITKPLVPRALWKFCKHLENIGVARHSLFSLFHPKLSIFIDPKTVDAPFAELVFTQSVDLLLVERPPDAIPRLAFDLHATDSPRLSKQKKKLFDSLGIHYQSIICNQFESVTSDSLDEVMADTPDLDKLRGVMNDWQWNAMLVLDEVVRKKGLFLMQEVALDSVISIQSQMSTTRDGDGQEQRHRNVIPWQDESFLTKTSFDGVICTRPPNCSPILAFEYDGFHHSIPSQRRKDEKKDKACEAANLPLVRIRSQDLPSPEMVKSKRTGIQQKQDLRRLEVVGTLRVLLDELTDRQLGSRWYLEQVHHFLTTTAKSIMPTLPDVADDIIGYSEEMLRQAKCSSEAHLLTKSRLKDRELELDRIRESGAQWMADVDERQYNENFRSEHFDEFKPMLEEDFESAIWKNHKGITVLECKFDQDHANSPWHLEVQSSPLLELGGMKLYRRFDGLKTDIKVVADRFNIAGTLKIKGSLVVLRERAAESLLPDKTKIIEALGEGVRLEPLREVARRWMAGWNKLRWRSEESLSLNNYLESKVDDLFVRAAFPKTRDLRVPLERLDDHLASVEELFGAEFAEEERKDQTERRHELAPRDYTPQELFRNVNAAFRKIKDLIPMLKKDTLGDDLLLSDVDFDADLGVRLLEHTKRRRNSALEELGFRGKTQANDDL